MKLKRFYKTATAGTHTDNKGTNGYGVFLDGKPIQTAGKSPLIVPTEPLATAIAQEWDNQTDAIQPLTMPQMRLANTTIDRIIPDRPTIHNNMLAYGENELLCYRDGNVSALRTQQESKWNPWLTWAEKWTNHPYTTTESLLPTLQSPSIKTAYDQYLTTLDNWTFTAITDLIQSTGSFILGSAVVQGAMTTDEAFVLSRLDTDFQATIWGSDTEESKNAETLRLDMNQTEIYLRHLGVLS